MNPKLNLIRSACRKLAPTFRRYYGEIGRTLVNPAAAQAITDETLTSVTSLLKSEFGKTGLPVVTTQEEIPNGPHWLIDPLSRPVNFAHGRLPVSVAMAYIEEDGACPVGAVYFPIEDVLVQAEIGSGASGLERFRASNRTELHDALLCLPWKTEDVLALDLLNKCENPSEASEASTRSPEVPQSRSSVVIHTRKTGDTLFDVIDVAAGRADIAIATRLTRLEALLARLILNESGAAGTDLAGTPLTAKSTTLLAAPFKLHPKALAVFKS